MSHFGTGQRSTKVPREWLTQFELSDQKESPRYAETMAYFNKLAASSPHAKMFTFGVSPQGRDLNYLVVSNSNEFSPQQVHNSRKAIVLIQNGIHAGEIEGKDASMLLLRDILITKEKSHLLENLILLVIPILNVDGHERISPANGPNQNGPAQMGWRTTSQNLNLNRDYIKAALTARSDARLYPVVVSNFGCGPDGFTLKHMEKILRGKPTLFLEFDEHRGEAGMVTRLEAFLDEVAGHRKKGPAPPPEPIAARKPRRPRARKFYIPYFADDAHVYAGILRYAGFEASILPPPDAQSRRKGEKFSSGKECHPYMVLAGDLVRLVESRSKGDPPAVFMFPGTAIPC